MKLYGTSTPTNVAALVLLTALIPHLPAEPLSRTPTREWQLRLGNEITCPPVANSKAIYCIADGSKLCAIDTSGHLRWTKTWPDSKRPTAVQTIAAAPACSSDAVIVATQEGMVYAIQEADGAPLWEYDAGERIQAPPHYSPNGRTVYVIAQPQGAVHAIDARTGQKRWASEPATRCDGTIAVSAKAIVFGACSAAFHVLSPRRGDERALIELGEGKEMAGGVTILNDMAIAGNRSGSVAAVSLPAEKVAWEVNLDNSEVFTTPLVTQHGVIVVTRDGLVACISPVTGDRLWAWAGQAGEVSSPVCRNQDILVAMDGSLHMLTGQDGTHVWAHEISDRITQPLIINNRIILGTDDGRIICMTPPEN